MVKVGGEVDAFCTRCELVLAHTVIAMVGAAPVKVECNTCHSVHRHRAPAGASARPRPATRTARAPAPSFDEELARRTGPPRRYLPSETFAVGDVLDHATFGRGFVSSARGPDKVDVTFRGGVRTLVQGKRPA
jgi:hypothetical protein